MADYGEKAADKAQKAIEKRLRAVYQSAYKELEEEFANFVERSRKADESKRKQKEAGIISEEDYKDWLAGQEFIGKQWKAKMDHASDILLRANQEAMNIINNEKMDVFAENANFAAYELEKKANLAFGFGIYDADAVGRLLREQPELLPRKVVNGRKDKAWNQRKIANCVAQGIIQGNSIEKIANRIAKQTSSSNFKAMTRYARTAVTGAQNAGRLETMHRAQGMGIRVKKKWLATLDKRTRDSHARLDGQVQEVDKPFESIYGKIRYPGDPEAHPGDVYNCRCTLEYVYPDFSDLEENVERYDQEEGKPIKDMTYSEWKKKESKPPIGIVFAKYNGMSYVDVRDSLAGDVKRKFERTIMAKSGNDTYAEYWSKLVGGKIKDDEIEALLSNAEPSITNKAVDKEKGIDLYRQFVEGESVKIHRLAGVNPYNDFAFDPSKVNEEKMKDLDAVFTPAKEEMHLYKGMSMTDDQIDNLAGEKFNHTLSSTSFDRVTAESYMEKGYDIELTPVFIDIEVEKGVPIVDARKLLGSEGMKSFEKEITIGRNVVWEYGEPELKYNSYGDEYYFVKARVKMEKKKDVSKKRKGN